MQPLFPRFRRRRAGWHRSGPALLRALALAVAATAIAGCGGGSGPGSETSTFSKSYGGPLHDEAVAVLETDDGGFMLFGSADGDEISWQSADSLPPVRSPKGGDFWLQKLDANGNVEHARTLGVRSPSTPGTVWARARPMSDGGVVLVGYRELRREVMRPGATADTPTAYTASRDIALARLDAAGNTLWRVDHDSGAWLNYDYFELNGQVAAGRDQGEDVWPLPDGGFLVAGTSTANLEDRSGAGFPCSDPEYDAIDGDSDCVTASGSRFLDAESTVVLRLDADGSLRWIRRLTDGAFDAAPLRIKGEGLRPLVRATADGGAIVARSVGKGALVHRLRADGSVRWRRAIAGFNAEDDRSAAPPLADIVQTDDPVDGADGDLHDGQRDDGFLLASRTRVVKLDAEGALQWNTGVELEGLAPNHHFSVHGLAQHCDYGRPTRCDAVVVGSAFDRDLPNSSTQSGFIAFLDLDAGGERRAEAWPPTDPATGSRIATLLRIAGAEAGTGRLRLLGVKGRGLALIDLEGGASAPVLLNERGSSPGDHLGVAEFRADGGVLLFDDEGSGLARIEHFDAEARLQSALSVGNAEDGEVLRAAVQIGPGRYVLAGIRRASNGRSGIVALRYDLDATGGRVVWQRRLVAGNGADVLAAVASGDGGLVLSAWAAEGGATHPVGQLLKLDGDGRLQWHTALPGPGNVLQRMPDGGYATLSFTHLDTMPRLTRLSSAGAVLWQNSVSLNDLSAAVQHLAPTADGGLLLAGSRGARISLVRLAADGSLASAVDLQLPGTSHVGFEDLRLRQTPDGGFVLAMSESGLLEATSPQAGAPLPRGQSNVLVLKLDAGLRPSWSHVYGGLFDDGVRDLLLRADGTIAVAGYSDSLGDRREAWLLKLAPSGLISEVGCQALLASIAPESISVAARTVTVAPSAMPAHRPLNELPPFEDADALEYAAADFVTARQCLGDAEAGGTVPTPAPTWHLSVLQVGLARGVVTSEPVGISCATGLDICGADFPQGSRIVLRADATRFVAWRGDCDEDTGGTRLDCVIRLDRNRTIQVEFGAPPPPPPPPPARYVLSFAVQGEGFVRTADGIDCGEGGSAAACSREYVAGTQVEVSAVASTGHVLLGWSGETAESICRGFGRQTSVRISVDANLRCFAVFGPATVSTLTVLIGNGGAGQIVDSQPAGIFCSAAAGSDCSETFAPGTTVLLHATLPGFRSWQGCDLIVDVNYCRLTMDSSRTVAANFGP